jgi:hypothetical protein
LRETFLIQLGPDLDTAARTMAELLWTWMLERWPLRTYEEPWVRTQLKAVAADLRFLAGFLGEHLAEQRAASDVTTEEKALLERVGTWARDIERAAETIEGGLAEAATSAAAPAGGGTRRRVGE